MYYWDYTFAECFLLSSLALYTHNASLKSDMNKTFIKRQRLSHFFLSHTFKNLLHGTQGLKGKKNVHKLASHLRTAELVLEWFLFSFYDQLFLPVTTCSNTYSQSYLYILKTCKHTVYFADKMGLLELFPKRRASSIISTNKWYNKNFGQ